MTILIPVPFDLNDPRDIDLYHHLKGLVRYKSTGLPPPNDWLPAMEVDWHDAIKIMMRKYISETK